VKLTLGQGLDIVQFGATEQQVIALLGEPDKIYFTDADCKRVQYNVLQLEFSFEPENENRFGWVEVYNSNATLFGKQLIGTSENDVIEFLTSQLDTKPTYEDYGSFVSYTYDNEWLELQFEFGRLRNINFGVLYSDKDAPVWPRT